MQSFIWSAQLARPGHKKVDEKLSAKVNTTSTAAED